MPILVNFRYFDFTRNNLQQYNITRFPTYKLFYNREIQDLDLSELLQVEYHINFFRKNRRIADRVEPKMLANLKLKDEKEALPSFIESDLLGEMMILRNKQNLQKIYNSLTCVCYYYLPGWAELIEAYKHANGIAQKHRPIKFFAINVENPEFGVILKLTRTLSRHNGYQSILHFNYISMDSWHLKI